MPHPVAQSGFFPDKVVGHLRPSAQIVQWNIASPQPSGFRHVESGAIKRTAHIANRGGFTAQLESGKAIDWGRVFVPEGASGFKTDTIALTFNFGLINENPLSRFDRMWNKGSGTAAKSLVGFNFRMWMGELDAFDIVAKSGLASEGNFFSSRPIFHFRESAQWRQGYKLELTEPSGGTPGSGIPDIPVSGVLVVPSSMPDCPNVHVREDDISISGSFKDREFTNFVYLRGFFPNLPSGQDWRLGTYGGLGLRTFRLKFSYDYTSFGSNILDPQDLKDFPVFVEKEFPDAGIEEGVSGWWQLNENSPRLSRASGFPEHDMDLIETVEGGGSIGRGSGIVASGSASGFAALLRSNRRDFLNNSKQVNGRNTTDFASTQDDGPQSFTITGWIRMNDPSGIDPAATGVGARTPWSHTGIVCRWNFRFSLQALQYRLYYHSSLARFIYQWQNRFFSTPSIAYNFMNVDSQDNGFGADGGQSTFGPFGSKEGGGGVVPEKWYFFVFGYDKDADPAEGSNGGNCFFRINDGPIDRIPLGDEDPGLVSTQGSTADPPFSLAGFTRTAGNGSIGPGAGHYDNVTLHRGVVLTNEQQLIMYNNGRGQDFPPGKKKIIDFSLPPEQALLDVDPDPVPLRRSLRAWHNFSEPSGADRLADSQRYWDLVQPPNQVIPSGAAPSGMHATSGIVVDEIPTNFDLATASGALQVRNTSGEFYDGQPGNGLWWQSNNSQAGLFGYMSYTIVLFCRWPDVTVGKNVCGVWTAAGNNRHWAISQTSNAINFFRANGTTIGQPSTLTTSVPTLTSGDWYMIAIRATMTGSPSSNNYDLRMDVTNLRTLQSDSAQLNDETFNSWSGPPAGVPLTIGAIETLGTPSVGDTDFAGFGVWYRSLTDNELSILRNSGQGLNFGAASFGRIDRVYWDSDLKRANDPSTI